MNFLFTADWHLKTKFKNIPVKWLYKRYISTLEWLDDLRVKHNVDTLVIGGDLFDVIPSMYDLAMFAHLFHVTNFDRYVIYPGNHELASKHTSFYKELHRLFPYPQVMWVYDEVTYLEDWCIIPYPLIKHPNIGTHKKIMTHVRCDSPRGIYSAEIDFSYFDNSEIVLAGDIHEFYKPRGNFWYPGALFDTSVVIAPPLDRYVLLVQDTEITPIKHEKLLRTFKYKVTPEEYKRLKPLVDKSEHYIELEVILDTISDFQEFTETSTKIKKVLRKPNSTFTSEATDIEDRLFDWLLQVFGLSTEEANKVMSVYKDL